MRYEVLECDRLRYDVREISLGIRLGLVGGKGLGSESIVRERWRLESSYEGLRGREVGVGVLAKR